jgi:hypothetical protein
VVPGSESARSEIFTPDSAWGGSGFGSPPATRPHTPGTPVVCHGSEPWCCHRRGATRRYGPPGPPTPRQRERAALPATSTGGPGVRRPNPVPVLDDKPASTLSRIRGNEVSHPG